MKKDKLNDILRILLLPIYYAYYIYEKIKCFFERDAYVTATPIYDIDNSSGKYIKKIDSFKIHIIRNGKIETTWDSIGWEDHEKMIDLLKNSNGHVRISVDLGLGAKSPLFIPKWAKQKIIDEIIKVKKENIE